MDLRHTRRLSEHLYLFSSGSLTGGVNTFLASRLLRGRSRPVSTADRPAPLDQANFRGRVYRLQDLVLDVPSLMEDLAFQARGRVFKVDWTRERLARGTDGRVALATASGAIITARHTVLTAGRGNARLLERLGHRQPAMQTRPLRQVLVKHPALPMLYGHCLGAGSQPRLTISSHRCADGTPLWYLGGALAEDGTQMSKATLIPRAEDELQALFPRLPLDRARWACLRVERAESRQAGGRRPDGAQLQPVPGTGDLWVAWPTKLTLAPPLADSALHRMREAGLKPASTRRAQTLSRWLEAPPLAAPPWERLFTRERPPC